MIISVEMAKKRNEDVDVVIKPITRFGGLDNIHIALAALVVILVLLLFVISGSHTITVINGTNTTNQTIKQLTSNYTCNKGVCTEPVHSVGQVKVFAEQVLASYNYVNSSLSLIAYFSDIANATYAFVPKDGKWYVTVPASSPSSGVSFYESLVIYDSNLSLAYISIQTEKPSTVVQDRVVVKGVIDLNNKLSCLQQNPVQVFWFMDPYAVGAISSLNNVSSLESRFGSSVNVTFKILFRGATSQVANQSGGLGNAQELGRYILCASEQKNFGKFGEALQSAYAGQYLPGSVIRPLAQSSGINMSELDSCIANSTPLLNRQSLLAQYYNITSTPVAVVNCKYLAIPQTVQQAVCYDNSSICSTNTAK